MSKSIFTENKAFAIAVLIILGLVLYVKTVGYEFVWDDTPLYLNTNNYPEDSRLGNISKFWTPGQMPMYAPITYTSWGITASLSGKDHSNKAALNPFLFHLTNVFVHIANSILVFLILLYLFKNNFAALTASAVFLLHPIQVESVAWVSELRGLLAAFFGLFALLLYIKSKNDEQKISIINLLAVVALLIFSFLSKPTGIVFPLILLTVDFFYLKSNKKLLIKNSLILISITLVFFLLSVFSESQAAEILKVSFIDRLLLPLHSFVFYLYKTILPINLTAVYGKTPAELIASSELYIFAGVFLVIALVLHLFRYKLAEFSGGLIIAFISIIPTSGLVAYYYQTFSNVADRYFYIGMFGIAIILTIIFKSIKTKQKTLITSSLIVLLLILSWRQIPTWANEYKLWDNVIENSSLEIPQAYMGRGEENINKQNYEQAIEDFTKAIQLNPEEPLYYYNRANAYLDIKQYENAIRDYDSALSYNDKLVNAYINRGLAYSYANKQIKAINDFKKALLFNPNQGDVCNNTGISFAMEGLYDSAEVYFKKALAINPNDAEAKENLKLLNETKQSMGK